MGLRPQDQDTICAQSTPVGSGGLAVLRVSGEKATSILRKVCSFLPDRLHSHRIYFGPFCYQKEVIDEVVLLYFEKGRSFTSETTFEICCHGSQVICFEILKILQNLGCRLAQKGEFTYRAFLSGRIDLAQAESVLHLIEAKSLSAKKQALRNLRGGLSGQIKDTQTQIQYLLSQIEAQIDFSEEDLSILSKKEFLKKMINIELLLKSLTKYHQQAVWMQEGLRVGIFGKPNSGKSSLFNQFLREEKAIVSSIKGTTRDQIEGDLYVQEQVIKLIDTAGIRSTKDPIEQKGLQHTLKALKTVDVCLYIVDASQMDDPFFSLSVSKSSLNRSSNQYKEIQHGFKQIKNVIFVFNKMDLTSLSVVKKKINSQQPSLLSSYRHFFVSAKTGEGINQVEDFFAKQIQEGKGAVYVPRHFDQLVEAKKHIHSASLQFEKDAIELCAFELKEGLKCVQSILGVDVDTDVVNQIFQQFCIGK